MSNDMKELFLVLWITWTVIATILTGFFLTNQCLA